MLEKIKNLVQKYWDIITYLIFGVLTTVVNYLVYLPLYNYLHIPASVCNMVAWVVAVAFAFLTNKPFVFGSHDWSMATVGPELMKFALTRMASGAMETGMLYLAVDVLGWSSGWCKIVASVFVVIVNYIGSKLLVFRKKED